MKHPHSGGMARGQIRRRFDMLLKGLAAVAKREDTLKRSVLELGEELIAALERCRERPLPTCSWCGHSVACHPKDLVEVRLRPKLGGCWGDKTAAGDCHCPSFQPPAEPPSCQCAGCVKARLCLSVQHGLFLEHIAVERQLSEELDAVGVKGGRTH